MHESLKKFWKENEKAFLLQPMTAFFTHWTKIRKKKVKKCEGFNPETFWPEYDATGVKGFIFENHIGIQKVKEIAGKDLFVYGMRHGDDWCKPCDIENHEVMVNFYAYFVTDQNLDHFFTPKKDWKKIYDWSMDWGDEHYWED